MKTSKDKFYFSHDSNARRDPKMIALIGEWGLVGYGMFFIFIEVLREQEGYKLDTSKKYILASVANELHSDVDKTEKFIKDCIDFELLESDGIFVWSNSLNSRMEIFESKKQYYRDKANKRWDGGKKKTEIVKTISEKKEVPTKSVKSIKDDKQFAEVILSEIRTKDEFKGLTSSDIEKQRQIAISWLESTGKRYSNYKAFFFNWLRRHVEKNNITESKGKGMVY